MRVTGKGRRGERQKGREQRKIYSAIEAIKNALKEKKEKQLK